MAVAAHHKHAGHTEVWAFAVCLAAGALLLSVAIALLSQPAVQAWIEFGAGLLAQKIVGAPTHLSPLH